MNQALEKNTATDMLNLLKGGLTILEIAHKYKMSRSEVRKLIKNEMIIVLSKTSEERHGVLDFKANREIANFEKNNQQTHKLEKLSHTKILRTKPKKISKVKVSAAKVSTQPIKYGIPRYNKKRAVEILQSYRDGQTLEEIASKFGLTRERIRQILKKQMTHELAEIFGLNLRFTNIRKSLEIQAEFEIRKILKGRKEKRIAGKEEETSLLVEKARSNGIIPENYQSLDLFVKASGIRRDDLLKYCPEVVEEIRTSARKRWSRYYVSCRSCGTTTVRHRGFGYCDLCYFKSPEFKDIQRSSHLRNRERINQHQKEYQKEYNKRPEIKLRNRLKNDAYEFDGNREKAIERDGSRCTVCGISRDESQKKYGKDLYVARLDGNKNNNVLANLRTRCSHCFKSANIGTMLKDRGLDSPTLF